MKAGITLILSGIFEIAITSNFEDFMLKLGVPESTVHILLWVGVVSLIVGLYRVFGVARE